MISLALQRLAIYHSPMVAERFNSIQVARAAAAIMVVALHAGEVVPKTLGHDVAIPDSLNFGFAGVDLFFCISGFIISLVVERSETKPGLFLQRRFWRILPIYWLFTLLWFFTSLAAHKPLPSVGYLLASVTAAPLPDLPYLWVGWSLEHELIFYGLVLSLMAARQLKFLPVLLLGLFAVGAVLHVANPGTWDFHLLSLYHLEFLAGVLLYRWRAVIMRLSGPTMLITGSVVFMAAAWWTRSFYSGGHLPTGAEGWPGLVRVTGLALASFLTLGGLIAAEAKFPSFVKNWPMTRLIQIGDASFVLYLMHPIVVDLFEFVGVKLHRPILAWPLAVAALIVSVVAALIFTKTVELPYRRWSHGLTKRNKGLAPQT